jgi:hypothetical protein
MIFQQNGQQPSDVLSQINVMSKSGPTSSARDDYNSLLEFLVPFAEQMLRKQGGFFPFAAAVTTGGEVEAFATAEESDTPEAEQVMGNLTQGFTAEARAGKIRTTAICFDGRVTVEGEKTDAIIIKLEHVSGEAAEAYVPYRKIKAGKYELGDLAAGPSEPTIFKKQ